jgi:hypothetical protein
VADADPGGRRPSIRRAGQDTVPKFARIVKLVERICRLAGNPGLIEEGREDLVWHGVPKAIRQHDTATIFDWLFDAMSYQGLSDDAVYTYMERHGRVRWQEIGHLLEAGPRCPKLIGFETFVGCGYQKTSGRCACPELLSTCPLPSHDLRNGRLNQAAYSLFLFMRDVAGGDFVGWIDNQLAKATIAPAPARAESLRQALREPLGHVYGVSNKVLAMALSRLLLAGDPRRKRWTEAGAVMIAVDTLVHNFLHRTGILARRDAAHAYGARCYRPNGCAAIIERIAAEIDARRFNRAFPANFPRFVQHAIWRFCAQSGLNQCNGRRIDDRQGCTRKECPVFRRCDRIPLHGAKR